MNGTDASTGPAFGRPVSVVTFGVIKVAVVVCATVLAMGGKIDSAGVTAIYTAVIAAGPIETAASGAATVRTRKVEAEVEVAKANGGAATK